MATLTERGAQVVDTLAPVLAELPDPLQIDGHTNQVAGEAEVLRDRLGASPRPAPSRCCAGSTRSTASPASGCTPRRTATRSLWSTPASRGPRRSTNESTSSSSPRCPRRARRSSARSSRTEPVTREEVRRHERDHDAEAETAKGKKGKKGKDAEGGGGGKKKLIIIVLLLAVVGGAGYWFFLKPSGARRPSRCEGRSSRWRPPRSTWKAATTCGSRIALQLTDKATRPTAARRSTRPSTIFSGRSIDGAERPEGAQAPARTSSPRSSSDALRRGGDGRLLHRVRDPVDAPRHPSRQHPRASSRTSGLPESLRWPLRGADPCPVTAFAPAAREPVRHR